MFRKSLICIAVACAFASCALPNMPMFMDEEELDGAASRSAGYERITKTDSVIVLAWDAPDTPVASYNVYYREHGLLSWNLLANVPATQYPEYAVMAEELHGLELDFAIKSVDASGNESDLHSSLDEHAYPPSGWYVYWDR